MDFENENGNFSTNEIPRDHMTPEADTDEQYSCDEVKNMKDVLEEITENFEQDVKETETADTEHLLDEQDGNGAQKTEEDHTSTQKITMDETVEYFENIIANDLTELKSEFPELARLDDIRNLESPVRYAQLRELGLTAREAYLATGAKVKSDTRSHLSVAYGKSATSSYGLMSRTELDTAREIFPELSDSEIHKLYRKAIK